MLDALTLDQLRVFLSVVDEGSFSAAARRLRRVQSAVSHSMANLERQLGVEVFDRTPKVPVLTEQGRVLLAAARRVCAEADELRQLADGMNRGLEPSVSLVVDALFPLEGLVALCRAFRERFPTVALRVHTETMAAVAARVLDGTCLLGVVGPAAPTAGLTARHVTRLRMIPVVSSEHALAKRDGRLTEAALAKHVQLVLSERAVEGSSGAPDQGVLSPHSWRVVDLAAKHALLRGGLGWGNMPEHMVRDDLERGALAQLRPAAWPDEGMWISLAVVHRSDARLGPAARWVLAQLERVCTATEGTVSSRDGVPASSAAVRGEAPGAAREVGGAVVRVHEGVPRASERVAAVVRATGAASAQTRSRREGLARAKRSSREES